MKFLWPEVVTGRVVTGTDSVLVPVFMSHGSECCAHRHRTSTGENM